MPIRTGQLPARLSETGLYIDVESEVLAPGVIAYTPAFELWSDGATKRRWVLFPESSQIDTADPDNWSFPVGTKFWKEFSREGVRIETRLLERVDVGDGDWAAVSYLWEDGEADAVAATRGVVDARGTAHNVPGASECAGCHGGRKSYVLGFSNVQLVGKDRIREQLSNDGRFSDPLPSLEIPGDDIQRSALGYLHANCSHCHNQDRPPSGCFEPDNELDFYLPAKRLTDVSDTPTYETISGMEDAMLDWVSTRGVFVQMPPIGTEEVDRVGTQLLREWVEELK